MGVAIPRILFQSKIGKGASKTLCQIQLPWLLIVLEQIPRTLPIHVARFETPK